MELIDFLAARITEEEQAAQAQMEVRRDRYPAVDFTPDGGEVGYRVNWGPWLRAEPLHILAECVAKRAIIEVARAGGDTAAIVSEIEAKGNYSAELLAVLAPLVQSFEDALDHSLKIILRLLALPYSSHPDYQQEWKRS